MRNRLAIQYAVEGDLRFISHHDTLRFFERALRRAAVPVRYSEGFNPRPRISICLPRPVGVESRDELLVVELNDETPCDTVRERLAPQLPPGMLLLSVQPVAEGQRPVPVEARYSLDLEPAALSAAARRAEAFLAFPRVEVDRAATGRHPQKSIDVRAYVDSVDVEAHGLTWTQRISAEGTARIGEVLEAFGLPGREHLHRVRRQRVRYRPS